MIIDLRWPLPDDFQQRTGMRPQTYRNIQFLKLLSNCLDRNNRVRRSRDNLEAWIQDVDDAIDRANQIVSMPTPIDPPSVSKYQARIVSIYFVQSQSGGPIKIGSAQNSERRLKDLRAMNPLPLVLLGTYSARRIDEFDVHEAFKEFRLHGEWFEDNQKLRQYITEHCGAEHD